MKNIIITISALVLIIITWNVTAYRDVDMLKSIAPKYINNMGMTIVNYDGYEGSAVHGGFVWYKATDAEGYLYEFCIGDWRGEVMVYNMTCLNAVKNN